MSKLEYNELEKIAIDLQNRNAQLESELSSMYNELRHARLDYLFRIVESKDSFSTQQVQAARMIIDKVLLTQPEPKTKPECDCKDDSNC